MDGARVIVSRVALAVRVARPSSFEIRSDQGRSKVGPRHDVMTSTIGKKVKL